MADSFADLTLIGALAMDGPQNDPLTLQRQLSARLASMSTEQSMFKTWCDHFDSLYFTTTMGPWGADLWADDPSATTPGRSHISINTPSVYVDVPAALQAVDPIENMLATKDSDKARTAANQLERVRKAWKVSEKWAMKRHKAATVKSLYGRTASYVYFDKDDGRPHAKIVENPRNLWMGYKSDNHEEVEWAARVELLDPMAVVERYSVAFTSKTTPTGIVMPWIIGIGDPITEQPNIILNFGPAKVEVWDYWYRRPSDKAGVRGKATKMETWNVVIAGNEVVQGPFRYAEYSGDIPYIPLFNTYIPGTPLGRSELHDMEILIKEKMTRVTSGAQMIAGATSGDYWQLVGPDAPAKVTVKPQRNVVVAPGAGNRIESIAPFVAQFQLEQFLGRLDREMAVVSGLNDLLLGLAPSAVLNSSKAINALIANYESRISMRRLLYYSWDRDTWTLALKVWVTKDDTVKKIVADGGGVLDITDPSLSPKDEMETATRAANLVSAKLWSQVRGMDAVGVDDPEQEQEIIREERTDATLWPADVQVMAQLMSTLQTLGLPAPQGAQNQIAGQASSGMNDLRNALGAATPQGTVGSQGSGNQGETPPIEGAPPEAGGAPAPFAQAQPGQQAGFGPQLQSMIQGGTARNRISITNNLPPSAPLRLGRR